MRFRGRDFLTLRDYSSEELKFIIETARVFKERFYCGERIIPLLKGKVLAMIFEKPSTRTRVSFEVAMEQLGGRGLFLSRSELQLGRGESIADTARVLSRYVDGIMARVYRHSDLEELAKHSNVPVINGLSDMYHPCQAVGDMLTIFEKKGRFKGLKLAWIGDGNNVSHSIIVASTKLGLDVYVATPRGYEPKEEVVKAARAYAEESGSILKLTNNPLDAIEDADVVYTDVWVSMGQEAEAEERVKVFKEFQVNEKLVDKAKDDFIFMHCLPAHRGYEVTNEVIDGPNSVVWDQAENRLHAQKAILSLLLG